MPGVDLGDPNAEEERRGDPSSTLECQVQDYTDLESF